MPKLGGVEVKFPDGSTRLVRKLIDTRLTKKNPKLFKSDKFSKVFQSFGLSLAPANTSGYQVCPHSTAGCRATCLYSVGRGFVWPNINISRMQKTLAWFQHRDWFKARLLRDLELCERAAKRLKRRAAVRLNVFSDIPWEQVFPELFECFPAGEDGVQFYDYTKNPHRMRAFCEQRFPENYHLTFSRSEKNEADCLALLSCGGTVAVVFERRSLPKEWHGYTVVKGDEHDLRFLDKPGTVVGLYHKGTLAMRAQAVKSGFVVRA